MAQAANELTATLRPNAGKGSARQVRREGRVPAIIYGDNQAPASIAVDYRELWKYVLKGHFTSTVFELQIDGAKHRVIPRDVQVDPVKDMPIHVDFLRIGKDGRIRVAIPVRFVNEALSPGLKRGGVLNIVRHEIEVTCPYNNIPAYFEVNLEGLEIGRSVHISAITLPEGVTPTIAKRDFTIATIAGAVKQEEETPAAVTDIAAAAVPGAAAPDAKGGAAAAAPAGKGGDAKAAEPKAGGDKKK